MVTDWKESDELTIICSEWAGSNSRILITILYPQLLYIFADTVYVSSVLQDTATIFINWEVPPSNDILKDLLPLLDMSEEELIVALPQSTPEVSLE